MVPFIQLINNNTIKQLYYKTALFFVFIVIFFNCNFTSCVGASVWLQEESMLKENGFISLYICLVNIFTPIPGTFGLYLVLQDKV